MIDYGAYFSDSIWFGFRPDILGSDFVLPSDILKKLVFNSSIPGKFDVEFYSDGLVVFRLDASSDSGLTFEDDFEFIENFEKSALQTLQVCRMMNMLSVILKSFAARSDQIHIDMRLVTPHDLILLRENGASFKRVSDADHFRQRAVATPVKSIDFYSQMIISRRFTVVSETAIRDSVELMRNLIATNGDGMIDLFDLIGHSIKSIEDHDYSRSLISSWVVIENLLFKRWNEFLKSTSANSNGDVVMNKSRRERLTGRDYSSSVVSEILNLSGSLSGASFDALSEIRRARNGWVHSLKPISLAQARDALNVLANFLELEYSISLTLLTALRL